PLAGGRWFIRARVRARRHESPRPDLLFLAVPAGGAGGEAIIRACGEMGRSRAARGRAGPVRPRRMAAGLRNFYTGSGSHRSAGADMPLSVECPECGARYNVPDKLAGKRAKCK